MDPNALKQLGLDGNISSSDAVILEKVFSGLNNGNRVKMSPQERNQLMARLSNQNSDKYVPVKDVEEMTPDERKAHREMLKKKLRDKKNNMEKVRTGGKQAQKSAMNSLQDILGKIDLNQLNTHAEQVAQAAVTNQNENINTNVNDLSTPTQKEESLDDFLDNHDD